MQECRWIIFPKEDAKCFGCGRLLKKSAHWKQVQTKKGLSGDPHFVFSNRNEKIHVCPICAMLARMKDNGTHEIREGEFNELTMANIHRKHKKEIMERHKKGESFYDIIKEMFPMEKEGDENGTRIQEH